MAFSRMPRMLQTAKAPSPTGKASDFTETYKRAYRWMLLARTAEEKIASLFRGGRITGGVFVGKGQEAVSVAMGMALKAVPDVTDHIRKTDEFNALRLDLVSALDTYADG